MSVPNRGLTINYLSLTEPCTLDQEMGEKLAARKRPALDQGCDKTVGRPLHPLWNPYKSSFKLEVERYKHTNGHLKTVKYSKSIQYNKRVWLAGIRRRIIITMLNR